MQALISVFLLGWFPLTLLAFWTLPSRRALLFSFIGGMILLPASYVIIPGLPSVYDRVAAVVFPSLAAIILTDAGAFSRLRLVATDFAMLTLVLVPIATSLSNQLGLYDGISTVVFQSIYYGLPYLFGRLYFRDTAGVKALTVAIAVGGILLTGPTLWEIRMSPQLHGYLFGSMAVKFFMFARFGGFRPIVFFPSPLMLTFVIAASTLCAVWLARMVPSSRFYSVRYAHWALLLALTTLLGKTFGAISIMIIGGGLLWLTSLTGRRWVLIAAAVFMFGYPALRITQVLKAETIMSIIEPIFPEEKVQTLDYRVTQEDLYAAHTMERPWLGWGGWGRNRTRQTRAIDGLWIVVFSKHGLIGVSALLLCFAIPVFRVWRRMPRRGWSDPDTGPAAVLSTVLFVYWIDCLLNGFVNPVLLLVMGGLAAWRPGPPRATESQPAASPVAAEERVHESPRFIDLKQRRRGAREPGQS